MPTIGTVLAAFSRIALWHWRPAWSKVPPPPHLQALTESVAAGSACTATGSRIDELPGALDP